MSWIDNSTIIPTWSSDVSNNGTGNVGNIVYGFYSRLLPQVKMIGNLDLSSGLLCSINVRRGNINVNGDISSNGNIYGKKGYFTGNIGINNSSPLYPLDVGGIINATALYVGGAPYIGSQWTTIQGNVYYQGNVKLGINANPTYTLDICGTLRTTGTVYTNTIVPDNNGNTLILGKNGDGGTTVLSGIGNVYYDAPYNAIRYSTNGSNINAWISAMGTGSAGLSTSYRGNICYLDQYGSFFSKQYGVNPAGSSATVLSTTGTGNFKYINGMCIGTGNNATLSTFDLAICSDYGIGFVDIHDVAQGNAICRAGIDVRLGIITGSSFNATSDYRVKENPTPINQTQYTVDNLIPVSYYHKLLKHDDVGFIAHEVQEYYPFMVSGEKDAVDASNNPQYQSLNYSGIIPILVAEVKELKKTVKQQQIQINTLTQYIENLNGVPS
jgi:hypothetical protein